MPKNQIELLAPAGDLSSFYAAIHNGADAVYLGAGSFGARSSAGFDNDALNNTIRYAHLHGKRIYVTLNTLIKQNELPEADKVLRFLSDAQVDAVIVQDIGLMQHIRENYPQLPIHASTQMSIHNAHGARFLIEQGVSRVVLARECSLETIKAVCAQGIETEVFVHGAQCVSVSGQCLISSHIGGRSGNRGRCAQPCRMVYDYKGQSGAWLSPRDMAQIENLGTLARAGVSSLKIEGRLKRPEYVATVTAQYRKALDNYLEGREAPLAPQDRKALLQIFSRGGFTQGWAFGQADANLINKHRVSHDGLPIGVIRSTSRRGGIMLSELELSDTLRHDDHLQIRGTKDQEMIYSGPEVAAGNRALIRHHQAATAGDPVFKLTDALQLARANEQTKAPMPGISISAALYVKSGEPSLLVLSSNRATVQVYGDAPQSALSKAMDASSSLRAIQKTGAGPFVIGSYQFEAADDCFMPVSSLNALRRDALEQLEQAHINAYQRETPPLWMLKSKRPHAQIDDHQAALYVRSDRIDQIDAFRAHGMRRFLYSPRDYTSSSLEADCKALGKDDFLCLPRQAVDATLDKLMHIVQKLNLSVMVDNIGQLSGNFPNQVIAGPGIPAWNKSSLGVLLGLGCTASVLSTELSKSEVMSLNDSPLQTILPVYGREMVMQLNHCPERTFRGLSGDQTKCHLCDAGQGTRGQSLRDKMGAVYPLLPTRLPEGCLNALLFHTPLHLHKKALGRHWLLDFTVEDTADTLSIISQYDALLKDQTLSTSGAISPYAGRFDEGVM